MEKMTKNDMNLFMDKLTKMLDAYTDEFLPMEGKDPYIIKPTVTNHIEKEMNSKLKGSTHYVFTVTPTEREASNVVNVTIFFGRTLPTEYDIVDKVYLYKVKEGLYMFKAMESNNTKYMVRDLSMVPTSMDELIDEYVSGVINGFISNNIIETRDDMTW